MVASCDSPAAFRLTGSTVGAVAGHFSTSAELSGLKEMSRHLGRTASVPKCLALVPKCRGSDVSVNVHTNAMLRVILFCVRLLAIKKLKMKHYAKSIYDAGLSRQVGLVQLQIPPLV